MSSAFPRKRIFGSVAIAIGALALGITNAALPDRNAGCAERVQDRLFFGLNSPEGAIGDAEWDAFVETVITPRFPSGLTIVQATGQWQRRDKSVTREASRVVEIIYDESTQMQHRVAEIASEYKLRYRQESVLIARARIQVCV